MALLTVVLGASFAFASDVVVIDRVVEEARSSSLAKSILVELCEKIGGRATGTPQLRKGEEWAVEKFKSIGIANARLEKWGESPWTFDRGPTQVGRMVSPRTKDFVFTTNCFTVGTKGPVKGHVVRMPDSVVAVDRAKSRLKGAWILMPEVVKMRGPQLDKPTDVDKAVDTCGIAGRIYTTGEDLVWTHGRWTVYSDETRPKTPLITVRGEDFDAISKAMDESSNVTLEFNIDNRITNQPMPLSNVVAEIPGVEKPDEVVIVGAHFDSWNGPGSMGAQDNGTGSSVVIEAARLLVKAGAKPKRTIRFILWTGEEQGLLGSSAYVEAHKDELHKISAVFNEDSGGNYYNSLAGTPDMLDILKLAGAPLMRAFPDMPVKINSMDKMTAGGGSDHASFVEKGVPGFNFGKVSGIDYIRHWHTQYDRPEFVPAINLAQMSASMAIMALGVADAKDLLPRVPIGN